MKLGEDFYTTLKKNNTAVWAIAFVAIVCSLGSLFFSWKVYNQSSNKLFAIDGKGELVPLKMLDAKNDQLIEAKANLEYFVNLYYNLDAYSMKRNRERVLWLTGSQPTQIIKDRASKGYFDNFLSIAGLTQKAEIMQNTLQINNTPPYEATFNVRIQRINGGVSEYYNSAVKLRMEKVNRNYPYNPYGLLITQFSDNLTRINDIKSDEAQAEAAASEEAINQNPLENDGTKTK